MSSNIEKASRVLNTCLNKRVSGIEWFYILLMIQDHETIKSFFNINEDDAKRVSSALKLAFKDELHLIDPSSSSFNRFVLKKSPSFLVRSGIREFDKLLDGGLKSGNIYQFFGPERNSTNKFLYKVLSFLLVSGDLPFKKNIFFIDTDGTFRPEMLLEFLHEDPDGLKHVNVARCTSMRHFDAILNVISAAIKKISIPAFIIINSIRSPSLSFNGKDYKEVWRLRHASLRKLELLARKHGACVLFNNHGENAPWLPAGNGFITELSTHIIRVSRVYRSSSSYVLRLIKSPSKGDYQILINVGADGRL
ncbi:MAG: hypothetical protein ACTSVI_07645 [Promethearchaeota archaeon]